MTDRRPRRLRVPAAASQQSGPSLLRAVAAACIVLISVAAIIAYGDPPGGPATDSWVYLAAGERLNAGHLLYALGPGDRPVALEPPYWSAPLLSPPPIAVLWRPLAVLGEPAMLLWWTACVIASAWLLARMIHVARPLELPLVAAIAPFVAINGWSGNANALLVPLLIATYSSCVGVAIAAGTAVKLSPALMLPWAHSLRRRQVAVTLVTGVLILAVSVLGAGIDSWVGWAEVLMTSAPSPQSIAGRLGISPALVVVACSIAAGLASVVLRNRPRASFTVACVLVVTATPALYAQGFAFLAAPLAIGPQPPVDVGVTAEPARP